MSREVDRFECILDPSEGWLVWDCVTDSPAELRGRCLLGLDQDHAKSLCVLLNKLGAARSTRGRIEPPDGAFG